VGEKLSVTEAAEYLGTCPSVVYGLVNQKAIPHYRIGLPGRRGKIVLLKSDLDAHLARCRVEGEEPKMPRRATPPRHPVPVKLRHIDLSPRPS
jgi:excisionase family DNA binding protein